MKKMNVFKTLVLLILATTLFGCVNIDDIKDSLGLDNPSIPNVEDEKISSDYKYVINDNKVTLTKYIGEYRTLIEVPTYIDGFKVSKIAEGCFRKNTVNLKPEVKRSKDNQETTEDNEISENSTYLISDEIENIENGAFEENSTFITSQHSKPHGWKDETMYGSAKEGTGNVYYGTVKEDAIVSEGIVYVRDDKLGGLYVARCLTQRKNVEIPSTVKGEKVIDVGREAFSHNSKIEKVVLPKTIGYVYHYAFYNCINLKEVEFNCPNLSKILGNSFNNCISLDIVRLPENITYIQAGAFSNCGELSELHIPFTMTSIVPSAFTNTTIKKIFYSGTEEQWSLIIIASDVLEIFNQAEIIFAESQVTKTLESLKEIEEIELNTFVEFEGVITGFYNEKGLWVTDPTDNYSIWCYNNHLIPFTDLDYIGRTIKVSGTKILYTGQIEVTQCNIELLDTPKTEIEPIELDLTDPNINLTDYLNHYVVVKGVYASKQNKSIYLEGSNVKLYSHYLFPDSPSPFIGDEIEVVGWVYTFNQVIEIVYDSRLLKIN